MAEEKINWKEQIGKRVIYTDRSGKTANGVVRDATQVSSSAGYFVDVKLDGKVRDKFFVPEDMVTLVPEELAGTL